MHAADLGAGPDDPQPTREPATPRPVCALLARPLSPCVPSLFTFWPCFLNSRVRPARQTRGVITCDRAGLAGRGGPVLLAPEQSTGEYRRMGFLNMQRRRIQRVTTVGFATVAMASFVAACSSSGGGGSSSGGSSSSSAALSGTLNASGSTFQLTFQQAAIQAPTWPRGRSSLRARTRRSRPMRRPASRASRRCFTSRSSSARSQCRTTCPGSPSRCN